ncbi:hypothetical protein FACS1894216_08770 [Synergistales bacterium]|nr:hypothetical protein FACS1894216_08770 [Synergistales bacterium]
MIKTAKSLTELIGKTPLLKPERFIGRGSPDKNLPDAEIYVNADLLLEA